MIGLRTLLGKGLRAGDTGIVTFRKPAVTRDSHPGKATGHRRARSRIGGEGTGGRGLDEEKRGIIRPRHWGGPLGAGLGSLNPGGKTKASGLEGGATGQPGGEGFGKGIETVRGHCRWSLGSERTTETGPMTRLWRRLHLRMSFRLNLEVILVRRRRCGNRDAHHQRFVTRNRWAVLPPWRNGW